MKPFAVVVLCLALLCAATAQTPAKAAAADPANAGRKQLTRYLNALAAKQSAARHAAVAAITTRDAALARQQHVRSGILALIGTLPERIPLHPRITGSTHLDGFRVDKVLFDSQPNFPVTALLYVPDAPSGSAGKFPAILMAPGHSPAGKAGDVAFATAFAHAGFVVLSYDPIGQGERLQYLDPRSPADKPASLATRPTGEHAEAALQPTLLGDAVARYFLWDGMRAVDYLASLPQVDAGRIGAFGCSGGGAMTALLGALDPRIAATGTACYTTSYDTLLPAIGPQDAEQSIPNFLASGFDFPDWVELAAPRPYAIIATTADMFPLAGAQSTESEARRFYGLLGADSHLAFITGPGGHGNLRPILPQILRFFTEHLHPDAAFAAKLPPVTDPFEEKSNPPRKPGERPTFPPPPPASLTQVTPTGQLSSSYPGIATVFTLNRDRAASLLAPRLGNTVPKLSVPKLQVAIREVTRASVRQGDSISNADPLVDGGPFPAYVPMVYEMPEGVDCDARVYRATGPGRHPVHLVISSEAGGSQTGTSGPDREATRWLRLAKNGTTVVVFTPRPSPAGTEETKSPILGPFYMAQLRSELVGKTLLGMRIDDVLRAVTYEASQPGVDPDNITAEASGHFGLVLLHAAVLDARLKHITVDHALGSYRGLVDAPLPLDAPQDILPGVLRRYDVPDLLRALGPRLTWKDPVTGASSLPDAVAVSPPVP